MVFQVVTNSCLLSEVDLYTVKKEDLNFESKFHLQVSIIFLLDIDIRYINNGLNSDIAKTKLI